MKTKYRAADGARFNHKKAQVYGEALETLKCKIGHDPTTDEIVEEAKRQSSPLHDYFEWDVRKAAGFYWKVQARTLVSHIEMFVVIQNKEVPIRAWFNVKRHPEDPQRYVQTESIANSPYMRAQVVQYALQEAKDWSRRYRYYGEFRIVRKAIKKTDSNLSKKRPTETTKPKK